MNVDTNLADIARMVLLKELRISACVLCGEQVAEEGMMVCKLHVAQV